MEFKNQENGGKMGKENKEMLEGWKDARIGKDVTSCD